MEMDKPRKRIFMGLLAAMCLMAAGLAFLLWWIPYVGIQNIHPALPAVLGAFFGLLVAVLFAGALTLAFTIVRGRDLIFTRRLRGAVVRFLLPLLVLVGKIFGVEKEEIQRSFIEINNQLVLAQLPNPAAPKVLLLLPHCLQNHKCKVRITTRPENCERCGKCPMKELMELSDEFDSDISVATGGTIARKIVVEKRPDVILAVACERDLTSGIQDSYPIPVYGILNRRPHGPCFNTEVDLEKVREGLARLLGKSPQPLAAA
jgi:hypothetical protein